MAHARNANFMLKKCLFALCWLLVFNTALAQEPAALKPLAQEPITYPGAINDSQEEQEFTVTLHEGDAVLIMAITQSGDLDTVVTVYAPSGDLVGENDDGIPGTTDSRFGFVAREDGVYDIVVTRYDSSTRGTFVLEITIGDVSLLNYAIELSGDELTRDSEHFRFHYTQSGEDAVEPEFLDAIVTAFEDSWKHEIDELGWYQPPKDDVMGGDERYDVYIMNSLNPDDDVLGFASPEVFVGDNPNSPETEQYAATSYIAIDNDFDEIEFGENQDALSLMRATAFHEFHHAIQFSFDGAESHSWLSEATATWMETVGAGKDQDATGYVETAFQYPELCFGTTAEDGSIMYGEWTFMDFLTEHYGDDAVFMLWQAIVEYEGFDAVAHLLDGYGTDVPSFVARYRLNNLARDYRLAPLFNATVWLENTITDAGDWTYGSVGSGVQELGANYYEFTAPEGIYDVELNRDDKQLVLWAIGLTEDGLDAIDLGRGGGIDTRGYERIYLMVFNPTYDNDVDDCRYTDYRITVKPGKGTINPVDHTLSRAYFEPLE